MEIKLTNEESLEMFYTALCNGLGYVEGYGLELDYDGEDYKSAREKLESPCYEDVLIQILKDGNKLTLIDKENDGDITSSITIEDVYDRVSKTPFRFLSDMINENDDAETADVIIQTVFYEEIIFG